MSSSNETPYEIGSLRRSEDGQLSFIGSSSGVYFINTVRQAFASAIASQNASTNHSREGSHLDDELNSYLAGHTPGDNGHMDRRSAPGNVTHERSDFLVELTKALPEKDVVKDLVTNFFRSWHPLLPFLYGPGFMTQLDSVYETQNHTWNERCFLITLHCVMRIAALDHQDTIELPPSMCDRPSKLMALLGPISLDNRLVSTQTLLAAQLYFTAALSLDAASTVSGLAVRSIVKSGLHRCPYRYPNIAEDDRVMRKRIFWSAYILDRFLTQSLGHPLGLQDGDIDVCLPSPGELHTRHLNGQSARPWFETDRSRKEVVLSNTIKCAKYTGQILEMFHKSVHARALTRQALLALEAEVDGWYNQLPRRLEGTTSSVHSKAFFDISYNHLKLLMNRPFLSLDPFSPVFLASMQKCLSAARNIIDTFIEQLDAGHDLKWPGYMSCAWMAGLLVAFAAQCNQYPLEHAKDDIAQSLEVLTHMGKRWKAAAHCANALRILKDRMHVLDTELPKQSPMVTADTDSPDLTELFSHSSSKRPIPSRERDNPGSSKRRRAESDADASSNGSPIVRQSDVQLAPESAHDRNIDMAPTPRTWNGPIRPPQSDTSGYAQPPPGSAQAMFAQSRQQALDAARTSNAADGMGYYYQPYPISTDMFQSTDLESLLASMDPNQFFPGTMNNFEPPET
ncbi:fungal-specific transcription factor domain-containing protein [Elsinoe ampelina]|uniref:Fungal-specific transcription factor domain-containing protein n=1 Tax=Elsinoe ampelina TaxID=302913 RepID=A0A6A6G7Y3_9PEZI|nr:fungal-specific transcription factor domain-containing protein [Elsinoe ampelina]